MRKRLIALGLGCTIATAVFLGWRALRRGAPPGPGRDALVRLLAKRHLEARAELVSSASGDPRARWNWIPESDARLLFPVASRGQRYDPWTYYSPIPGFDSVVPWPEHAGGSFRYHVNSMGLREDGEWVESEVDLRVLFTGDSHCSGFCENSESAANVLESRLASRSGRVIDVVNASNMGFSFHHYLAVFEKFVASKPQCVVVVVHGGNDFFEVLMPHRYLHHLEAPPEDPRLYAALDAAEPGFPPAIYQGGRSAFYFREHPEERAVALTAAAEVMDRIISLCGEKGIVPLVALLPAPLEVEYDAHLDRTRPVLERLGLSEEAFARHGDMGRDLLARLRGSHVECVDALADLRAPGDSSFWHQDLHLSVAGQARLANAIEPHLVNILGLSR